MVFACVMSPILVKSLWEILQWPKKKKYLGCFIEVPFMRCFVFKFLLPNHRMLPGHAKPQTVVTRVAFSVIMRVFRAYNVLQIYALNK